MNDAQEMQKNIESAEERTGQSIYSFLLKCIQNRPHKIFITQTKVPVQQADL
jgi:hypothetical protein